jgi:hypothetical protein
MATWTDDIVFGTSAASAGDNELRSIMTQLASGISASYSWPGSGGGSAASGGESKEGNARCARAGNSAVTGGYPDGFLLINTNHVSLHHIGSAWTGMLGHSSMIDHNNAAFTSITTGRWLTQQGSFSLNSSVDGQFGTKTVSFTSAYDGLPAFIALTAQQPTINIGYLVNVLSSTSTNFVCVYNANLLDVVSSIATVYWESDGTVGF